MIVRISAEAERDLEAIGDFIAEDNPDRAISFIRELHARCLSLVEFPERFPLVPRYASLGIRRRVYGNYLIFYRITSDAIIVLHVLHGAQDYTALLDDTAQ